MLKNPEKWPKFGKCDPKNPEIEKQFSLDNPASTRKPKYSFAGIME